MMLLHPEIMRALVADRRRVLSEEADRHRRASGDRAHRGRRARWTRLRHGLARAAVRARPAGGDTAYPALAPRAGWGQAGGRDDSSREQPAPVGGAAGPCRHPA